MQLDRPHRIAQDGWVCARAARKAARVARPPNRFPRIRARGTRWGNRPLSKSIWSVRIWVLSCHLGLGSPSISLSGMVIAAPSLRSLSGRARPRCAAGTRARRLRRDVRRAGLLSIGRFRKSTLNLRRAGADRRRGSPARNHTQVEEQVELAGPS